MSWCSWDTLPFRGLPISRIPNKGFHPAVSFHAVGSQIQVVTGRDDKSYQALPAVEEKKADPLGAAGFKLGDLTKLSWVSMAEASPGISVILNRVSVNMGMSKWRAIKTKEVLGHGTITNVALRVTGCPASSNAW